MEVIYKLTVAGILAGNGEVKGENGGERVERGGRDRECVSGQWMEKEASGYACKNFQGEIFRGSGRPAHIFKKKIFFSS